ncbi:unnamed protein product [Brassicogethes aeneus]|uniref:Uncharacterized protein n=1 Tax=Brassicogethes aeneus TaxID=1431903 RepID=A0A9P0FNJ6_BRAAE|nr:unnamed protein product [Brassicogethes aeneus]
MLQENVCPICQKLLELKQINLTTAVYLCVDLKCPYPVGYDCIEIERNILEIFKVSKKDKNEKITVNKEALNSSTESVKVDISCSDKNENVNNTDCSLDLDFTIENVGDNTAELQDIDAFLLDLLD